MTCPACQGSGYLPCKKCNSSGEDPKEVSGVCLACGGPGRFPCRKCACSGQVKETEN